MSNNSKRILSDLKPERVFYYFEEISAIPRGSRNTKAISDYCVNFARERNLKYIQDEFNNVMIFKDASFGYETHDAVILQGHLDMVNEKIPDSPHDFENDGLDLIIEEDWIRCKDTTLGGDDGIALAYALAVLDDNTLKHPPLEVVFTSDEEIGLLGASAIDVTPLRGKYLLNIDSDEEGVFFAGCAGGVTAEVTLAAEYTGALGKEYIVTVEGLQGGHSGMAIHKGYANAHKLLGRILYALNEKKADYGIASVSGGRKDNVIPSHVKVSLILPANKEQAQLLASIIQEQKALLKAEYQVAEPELNITVAAKDDTEKEFDIFSEKTADDFIFFLMQAPNGVQYMNQSISGLVETSLNMGILYSDSEFIKMGFAIRSSVKSAKGQLMRQVFCLAEKLGGECVFTGEYPEWSYRIRSKIREISIDVYKKQYGEEPVIATIHAGLECGIFSDKFERQKKELDMISFGPDIQSIHSVKESLNILSTERVWRFLTAVLEQL